MLLPKRLTSPQGQRTLYWLQFQKRESPYKTVSNLDIINWNAKRFRWGENRSTNSPRLPAEKRLEQADPDRASFPPTQCQIFWDPPQSLGGAANRCCGGFRLWVAPTGGVPQKPAPPPPHPTPPLTPPLTPPPPPSALPPFLRNPLSFPVLGPARLPRRRAQAFTITCHVLELGTTTVRKVRKMLSIASFLSAERGSKFSSTGGRTFVN